MTAKKPAIDAIIHIGAGRGKDLKDHISSGAQRIVLVDADEAAIGPLQRLSAGLAGANCEIKVVEAAAAGVDRHAELRIYNLERVSGICAADAAEGAYPGLKLLRTQEVSARAAADVIGDQNLDPEKENLLVIEAPGEELPILESLASNDMLAAFSRIKVSASREAPYKGGATASEIASFLEEANYLVTADDRGDWQFLSALIWRSGRHRMAMERINKELARVEAARAAQEKKVIELSEQNANLTAQIEKQKAEIAALDLVDREALFKTELSRCESQLNHLKGLFANGEE